MKKVQFGLDTFGEYAFDEATGELMNTHDSFQQVIKEGILADQLGLDMFALGEHHREEYLISAPDVVLAALSQVTQSITLGTAVTVLSSDDPVRVVERFSTLDALSRGRAQVMVGRGSFIESFPLFGYDLQNYNELFEEKLQLLNEIIKGKPLNWDGELTQSLRDVVVYPKMDKPLDVVVGVGGSPESIIRAAKYGFPITLAIIGGEHKRFLPYVDLYKRAMQQFNQPLQPIGFHSHGVIAPTDEEAIETAWQYYGKAHAIIGKERGWAPMTKERFLQEVKTGAYFVGSPETVAQKLAKVIKELGADRFSLNYSMGGQFAKTRLQTIKLYGEQVVPRVKELLNEQ